MSRGTNLRETYHLTSLLRFTPTVYLKPNALLPSFSNEQDTSKRDEMEYSETEEDIEQDLLGEQDGDLETSSVESDSIISYSDREEEKIVTPSAEKTHRWTDQEASRRTVNGRQLQPSREHTPLPQTAESHDDGLDTIFQVESQPYQSYDLTKAPKTITEATMRPDWPMWKNAMDVEWTAIKMRETVRKVQRPPGARVIDPKWVFAIKRNANGQYRYKARLVLKGFKQREGFDYTETFAPVVRAETLRWLVSYATQNRLEIHLQDISNAYLYADMDHVIFMTQPQGLDDGSKDVFILLKSLYGAKQAGNLWYQFLMTFLKKNGFRQSTADPCLYIYITPANGLIAVYVDDIFTFGTREIIEEIKSILRQEFDVKDAGPITFGLGVQFGQHEGGYYMHQLQYIESIKTRYFEDSDVRPLHTPMAAGTIIHRALPEEPPTQQPFLSLVGSLLYLATMTRPDISFAVSVIARQMHHPTSTHWTKAVEIFRYVYTTRNLTLMFSYSLDQRPYGYCDASFMTDPQDSRSQVGYLFYHGCNLTSWRSWRLSTVSWSSAEAEYSTMAEGAREAYWILLKLVA